MGEQADYVKWVAGLGKNGCFSLFGEDLVLFKIGGPPPVLGHAVNDVEKRLTTAWDSLLKSGNG